MTTPFPLTARTSGSEPTGQVRVPSLPGILEQQWGSPTGTAASQHLIMKDTPLCVFKHFGTATLPGDGMCPAVRDLIMTMPMPVKWH